MMGCFARTCGISGTGINEDEPVVIFVFNLPYTKVIDLSELIYKVSEQETKFKGGEVQEHTERFMTAVLNKEIKGMEDRVLFHFKPIKEILIGTYNDYGFINEAEEPEVERTENGLEHLIFHVWAVECLFNKKIDEITLDLTFARNLLWKLYHLRRSPIDWMLGQQHPDVEEMEGQINLNNRTNEYLTQKINKYKNKRHDT